MQVSYVRLDIISRIKMGDTNKLLFTLTSNDKKDMIVFLYLFDLFESSLIILLSYNSF